MSPLCQETDEAQGGGVGEEVMLDQLGVPERLGLLVGWVVDRDGEGWGSGIGVDVRYRDYIPSAMRCRFANTTPWMCC
jgi:hypothetical protein